VFSDKMNLSVKKVAIVGCVATHIRGTIVPQAAISKTRTDERLKKGHGLNLYSRPT
jgi:hypothetical protein